MKKSLIALAAITAANNLQLAMAASKVSEPQKPFGDSHRTTPAYALGGVDQHYLHQVADAHKITQALIARAQRDLDPISLPFLKGNDERYAPAHIDEGWPGIPKGDSIKKTLSHKPRFVGDQPPFHLLTDRKPRYTEEEHVYGGYNDIIKRGPQQRPTQAGIIGRS